MEKKAYGLYLLRLKEKNCKYTYQWFFMKMDGSLEKIY